MTTNAHDGRPTAAPTPTSPSVRALRVLAGGSLLALFVSFVLTVVVVLEDAISGDGRSGVFVDVAFWTLAAGAVTGLAAAVAPRATLEYRVRAVAVTAAWALAVIAPLVALVD
ncbi:hypothetical protein ACGFMM_08485 [Streptomyces sp. NPDC048604]|uniref:hypothetical protein n=1 Tax=Streptomyces sp. NPDC048604 TaxID=3365578 RepID=UPI003721704B